jgi:hypothetical protein
VKQVTAVGRPGEAAADDLGQNSVQVVGLDDDIGCLGSWRGSVVLA